MATKPANATIPVALAAPPWEVEVAAPALPVALVRASLALAAASLASARTVETTLPAESVMVLSAPSALDSAEVITLPTESVMVVKPVALAVALAMAVLMTLPTESVMVVKPAAPTRAVLITLPTESVMVVRFEIADPMAPVADVEASLATLDKRLPSELSSALALSTPVTEMVETVVKAAPALSVAVMVTTEPTPPAIGPMVVVKALPAESVPVETTTVAEPPVPVSVTVTAPEDWPPEAAGRKWH